MKRLALGGLVVLSGCRLFGVVDVPCVDDDNCRSGELCDVDVCRPAADVKQDGGDEPGEDAGVIDGGARDAGAFVDAGPLDDAGLDAGADAGPLPCADGNRRGGDGIGADCAGEPGFACDGGTCDAVEALLARDDFEGELGTLDVPEVTPWGLTSLEETGPLRLLPGFDIGQAVADLGFVVGYQAVRLQAIIQLNDSEAAAKLVLNHDPEDVSSGVAVQLGGPERFRVLEGDAPRTRDVSRGALSPGVYFLELSLDGGDSIGAVGRRGFPSQGGIAVQVLPVSDLAGDQLGTSLLIELSGAAASTVEVLDLRIERDIAAPAVHHEVADTFSRAALNAAELPERVWSSDGALPNMAGGAVQLAADGALRLPQPERVDGPVRLRYRVRLDDAITGAGTVAFNTTSTLAAGTGVQLSLSSEDSEAALVVGDVVLPEVSLGVLDASSTHAVELYEGEHTLLTVRAGGFDGPITALQVADISSADGDELTMQWQDGATFHVEEVFLDSGALDVVFFDAFRRAEGSLGAVEVPADTPLIFRGPVGDEPSLEGDHLRFAASEFPLRVGADIGNLDITGERVRVLARAELDGTGRFLCVGFNADETDLQQAIVGCVTAGASEGLSIFEGEGGQTSAEVELAIGAYWLELRTRPSSPPRFDFVVTDDAGGFVGALRDVPSSGAPLPREGQHALAVAGGGTEEIRLYEMLIERGP